MKVVLGFILLLIMIIETSVVFFDVSLYPKDKTPIKVGLIYSLTGYRSSREIPPQQATLMAIDEINRQGGLLGRTIVPVVRDAKSNSKDTLEQINNLLEEEKVAVIFGCFMPGNRHTTKKLFEKYENLLIYPFPYEGIVNSENIIFCGTTANQQIPPAVDYCLNYVGKRILLVGSRYIFPHIANVMIRDQVVAQGGEIVGEYYIPIRSEDFNDVITAIVEKKPDAIFNTVFSNDFPAFVRKLEEAGITADQIPNFSFNITESTLYNEKIIDPLVGQYATWNYFQTIDTPINHKFIKNFVQFSHLGDMDNTSESAYIGFHLWAKAVRESGTTKVNDLTYALDNMRFHAPEGFISLNMDGRYSWRFVRIGKVRPDRQFDIVWQSKKLIPPISYQVYRSNLEWEQIMEQFFQTSGELEL